MAVFRGVGVEDICVAESWSTPSHFIRYLLNVSSSSLAQSVLGATERTEVGSMGYVLSGQCFCTALP